MPDAPTSPDTEHAPVMRVLLVEDEPRLRDLLVHAVRDMDLPAEGAASAEQALRIMAERPATILVVDLNLPGMNGLEFLEVVRQKWPEAAAIILTAFGDLEAARRAIRLRVADFLTKPCHLGELEQALDRAQRRVIEEWRARLASAKPPGDVRPRPPAPPPPPREGPPAGEARSLEDVERATILAALERHGGNRAAVAAELGISLRTLYYRLAEYQKQGLRDEPRTD